MASSSRKYTLDKLTEKNYKTWKTRMELLLDVEELLDITIGASPEPKKTRVKRMEQVAKDG